MRVILLLAVLVIVLFCISLAVGTRAERNPAKPTNSWAARFNERFKEYQKLPTGDLSTKARQFSISQSQSPFYVSVTNSGRPVRTAEIKIEGTESFHVHYEPSPPDPKAIKLDPEAVKLDVDIPDNNGKRSIKLVFQKHGGTLTFSRKTFLAPATVTVD